MSSYYAPAIHPVTKQVEDAVWIDDYFGRHRYGVEFSDGRVFPADEVKVPKPREEPRG
jgi:hypothetical protein